MAAKARNVSSSHLTSTYMLPNCTNVEVFCNLVYSYTLTVFEWSLSLSLSHTSFYKIGWINLLIQLTTLHWSKLQWSRMGGLSVCVCNNSCRGYKIICDPWRCFPHLESETLKVKVESETLGLNPTICFNLWLEDLSKISNHALDMHILFCNSLSGSIPFTIVRAWTNKWAVHTANLWGSFLFSGHNPRTPLGQRKLLASACTVVNML